MTDSPLKLRSPTDTPVHLALTSGHTFLVGPDLVDVPRRFVPLALSKGCLREGELPEDAPQKTDGKLDIIARAIREMVEAGDDQDFNQDGKPDVRRLSKRAGFTVSSEERDQAWAAVQEDL